MPGHDDTAPSEAVTPLDVDVIEAGASTRRRDLVTTEEPLEIRLAFAGRPDDPDYSLSVTMRTPGHDFELVRGFLLTEGIVGIDDHIEEIAYCEPPSADRGIRNVVRVALGAGVTFDRARLARHFYTSSSCGVCGKASIDAVHIQMPFYSTARDLEISADALRALPEALRARQRQFDETGGLHASATFDAGGDVLEVREDVGRHNALDKLIGLHFERRDLPLADRGILLSGRASFELMQKAAIAGCRLVAAIGPPSSLAVELARSHDVTLVGFLRPTRFNVYSAPSRIAPR